MKRLLIVVAIAATLASCSSGSGTRVTQTQAESFTVGRSTYQEVLTALGPPTASSVSSKGTRMLIYSSAKMRAFIGITGMNSTTAMFTFDARDVLTDVRTSELNAGDQK